MAYLSDPKETIAVLQRYQFNFQKKFGQNFLIDGHVVDKIISAAEITKDDVVLEIGPGIGTMTQRLCEEAGDVIAVEIDRNLIPILTEDTCKDYKNLRIINEDVLKLDLRDVLFEYGFRPVKVVANLPYYITSAIITKLLKEKPGAESITVMMQKEVAERLLAEPGSRTYGAITVAVGYYADAVPVADVPKTCFMPRPKVDSEVVRLDIRETPRVQPLDEKRFFDVVRAAFSMRRKTLLNSLKAAGLEKDDIRSVLGTLGIDVSRRAETLSIEDFAAVSDEIVRRGL